MIIWNPWHGCHKISEGCQHCYMYFLDGKRGSDTSKVFHLSSTSPSAAPSDTSATPARPAAPG